MKKIIVTDKYNNKKLISFILDSFPQLNINTLYKALRKKDIRINNIKVCDNKTIFSGDEITIYISDENLLGNININIIYEDDNIIVVDKPKELSVTEDNSTYNLTSILKKQYGNNIYPCHRIDRNTKGLVLFAKNETSLNILLKKFKNKEIEKHYLALVYGEMPIQKEVLEAYLFKDSKKNIVYISDSKKNGYQKIITEYYVIKYDSQKNISYLDINLHTGKTHQIRAHLAHIGHPIIGDGKYGINEINKNFNKKTQELYSYLIKFNFKTDSDILNYLNGKEIKKNYVI